jgi:hypothetical protein
MTRSPHADPLVKPRRGSVRGRWLCGLLAAACGGRELSLGGDPALLTASASGGTPSAGAGQAGSVAGGAGGTSAAGTGGISLELGGSGGSSAEGATGGAGDRPYPPVRWGNGEGYRDVCPEYDGTSGFTCWYEASGVGTACPTVDTPDCNACSCAIPCEEPSDCPSGPLGEAATCLGSDTNAKSCFLACAEGPCPVGMTCSTYPGVEGQVCMWVDPSVGMNTPR